MNYLLGFLIYLPAVLAGGLLVHALWHGTQPSRLLLKLGLGIGLGLGLTSLLTFLLLLFTNKLAGFLAVQFILLLCGIILTWRNWKSNPLLLPKVTWTRTQKILLGVFGIVLLSTMSAYIIYAVMTPTGRFDAWMIYNRTARFIYRDPAHWQNTLSPELYWLFHADYPLLVPVNVAGAWNVLGGEIMRAPQVQSAYFLAAIVCVLIGAIAYLRTTGQALLAGITLFAVPIFFKTAAREEADIPLAFFILAALTFLFLYNTERKPALVALAGLTTGLAAWTKNEGLLFLVTGSVTWLIVLYRQGQWKDLTWYALGLALPLAIILYFKLFLAPSNDLFDPASSTSMLERLIDFERYPIIARSFYRQIFILGIGRVSILLLAIYGIIVGLDKSKSHGRAAIAASGAVFLQLAGYFLVYVLTPHDLDWHLRTSLYRLIIHIFPSVLLIVFAASTDPEILFDGR